jgi:RND superfamily putative drug exporter
VFDMPNPDIPSGSGVMDGIEPALKATAPPGVTVAVTGFEQIQAVGGSSAGSPSVLVETAIGGLGALTVLLFVYGSMIAIGSAVTLLPVLLATFGPALDSWRFRKGSTTFSRGWERWAGLIVRYRVPAAVGGLLIVIGLALPALSMNTGQPKASSLGGNGQPARTLHALEATSVPSAVVFPIQLLSHGGSASAAQAAAVAASTPGVYTVLAPDTPSFRHGQDALISVIPTDEGSTSAGVGCVARLRAALAHVPGGVEVGGNTAQNADFNTAVYGSFPPMLALIALCTFLLLARELRSVILAVKAVAVNLVSLGASFGFLVLFWQHGIGSHAVYGVAATGSIRNWVPMLMFAFLFGISMDYEVFILAGCARSTTESDRRRPR